MNILLKNYWSNKMHDLKFLYNGSFGTKVYYCNKCKYQFISYHQDNYDKKYYSPDILVYIESLTCEEMQIKKLLE